MKYGNVYDIDPAWADVVAEGCPGVEGASCLIPVPADQPAKRGKGSSKGSRSPVEA